VPKHNPHERRPRAPDWEPDKVGAEIAELAAASDACPLRPPCGLKLDISQRPRSADFVAKVVDGFGVE